MTDGWELERDCPCGSGQRYDACCGRYHLGSPAPTAEALMRSRYTAFTMADTTYLFRTWHPRTRPAEVTVDPFVVWQGLEVTGTVGGGEDDEEGEVAFVAHWRLSDDEVGKQVERSRFERRAGRWMYVDGDPA